MVRNPSSLVIDSLCDQARKEDITVACLYCDFLAQQEQTIANMMGAILKQLVSRGSIPTYLREAFQEGQRDAKGDWWQRAPTGGTDENVEDGYCFVVSGFHLYRCPG